MGWDFFCDPRYGRKEVVAYCNNVGENYELIAHRLVGNHLWQVTRRKRDGHKGIHLCLLKGGGKGSGWGYKALSESSGPVYHDCPVTLLAMCDPPQSEYATKWREAVMAWHAKRKAAPKPSVGLIVPYNGKRYQLVEPIGGRKGWVVVELETNQNYRMASQILAAALRDM